MAAMVTPPSGAQGPGPSGPLSPFGLALFHTWPEGRHRGLRAGEDGTGGQNRKPARQCE